MEIKTIPEKVIPEQYVVNGGSFSNLEDAQKELERVKKEERIKNKIIFKKILNEELYLIDILDQECLDYISIYGNRLLLLNNNIPDNSYVETADFSIIKKPGKYFVLLEKIGHRFETQLYSARILEDRDSINKLLNKELENLTEEIEELNLKKHEIYKLMIKN
jgi:hypothetical protein